MSFMIPDQPLITANLVILTAWEAFAYCESIFLY